MFVVDDDDAVRDALHLLLEQTGFNVDSFASCAQALDAVEAAPPACMLLDLHLPDMSGLDLLNKLAERRIHVPVVLMSGRLDRRARDKALAAGAAVTIDKPISEDDLLNAIDRARRTAPMAGTA